MNLVGVFSGIGGFELGFEQEGYRILGVCEIDPFCQSVLRLRFPMVPLFPDIRTFSLEDFLVKTLASLGKRPELMERKADYGLNSKAQSSSFIPHGLSSKTSGILGAGGCPSCGATCKGSGMPACRFECEPVTWEPPMRVLESSLLPTPTASSYGSCRGGGSGRVGKWRKSLHGLGIQDPDDWERLQGFPVGWTDVQRSVTP